MPVVDDAPVPVTGKLAYAATTTGHVRVLDLATGDDRELDPRGAFGNLTWAPDAQQLAYQADAGPTFVTDLSGHVSTLPSAGNCFSEIRWGAGGSLLYCTHDGDFYGSTYVPTPTGTPRHLSAYDVATTPDGQWIIYGEVAEGSPVREIVVEHPDGTARRVLRADVTAQVELVPAGDAVLASEYNVNNGVITFERIAIATGAVTVLGTGYLPVIDRQDGLPPTSHYSPDGSRVLMVTGNGLAAVELATGARQTLAPLPASSSIVSAGFVDAQHVVYTQNLDLSVDDIGVFVQTVHLTDGTTDRVLSLEGEDSTTTNYPCSADAIDSAQGVMVLSCNGVATFATADGTKLASNPDAISTFGILPEGVGYLTGDREGHIAYQLRDGTVHPLVTAGSPYAAPPNQATGRSPYVAFHP